MVRHLRAVAAATAALALTGCWPAPHQGPDRAGWNAFETSITTDTVGSLDEAWTADLGGRVVHVVSTATSAFATVRTGTLATDVRAIDPKDGSTRWSQPSPYRFQWTSPLAVGDEVLASYYAVGATTERFDAVTGASLGTRSGEVSSVRGTRSLVGQAVWNSEFTAGIQSFRVEDDGNGDATWGGVVAVVLPWDPSQVATLSLGRERVYAAGYGLMSATPGDGTQGYGVRAFAPGEPATCGPAEQPDYACPVWVTPVDGPSRAVPVIGPDEGTVYVTTDAGTVYALDAANGAVRWTAAVGAVAGRPPALAEGLLYVATGSGGLAVLAADGCGAATCGPLWEAAAGGVPTGQPAVAGGVVYVGTDTGAAHAFDATGCGAPACEPLWSTGLGSEITAGPIVAGGRLTVGTADGRLVTFRPASGG
ncbi:MAG TPA: PQQ-binding-like beta-propeller repeat protein [Acidimicrobiales bacterium]|nr:PQQ-binding-like beta-propeller repeat protein [Acidimicrobiales bacterium]